jgi:hypothetical protein
MSSFFSWWGQHFTPMLSWWQWLLVGLVPPAIVLLYFLKLRRLPLTVPSTFLWRRSIEDMHVNSIWQRLRQNLLLFLQLLIVALAILALLRPGWRGSKLVGDRFVFLVDNSASMNATDVAPTRLAEAKRRAAELIDQMRSGDVAMVVSFSDAARVEQPFTDNRRELRRQLEAIEPTNRSTSLSEALRVATGHASAGRAAAEGPEGTDEAASRQGLPATIYILSDGKFPDVPGVSLGNLKPVYVPIGSKESANIGITSFRVRRAEGSTKRLQAFARIENDADRENEVHVALLRDGHVIDADKVPIKPHESTGVAFKLADMGTSGLELQITPGGDLPQDDHAWATVSPPRHGKVLLVTPGNDALEFALGTPRATELADVTVTAPAVLTTAEHKRLVASGAYDLIIYDQCQPTEMPQANTLFIGRLPPSAAWGYDAGQSAKKLTGPQIIDVESIHPLVQLIDLSNVSFVEAVAMKVPPGGTRLIDSNKGVLLAIAPREGFEDAVLAAEIVGQIAGKDRYANTDWPLRLSFPVFVLNVLEYLGGTRDPADAGVLAPGRSITLRSATNAPKLTVQNPAGKTTELKPVEGGTFHYASTDELGIYRVNENQKLTQAFAVNLFDSAESEIRPRPENSIRIGYVDVKGEAGWEGARRELWKPLAFAALLVLLGEWYIYNRRVYI